ncbi:peptidoglycan-binding domain-containing protein [Trueperella sp.]|uniref:peptidoglycan-binding domain-containing protein n=1 Tax=Trueperella sp. TaxID=2699835 RepID=UPI0022EA21E1|nr:peptidoglycan-binding domain-containing protein [Trueperella sp.]
MLSKRLLTALGVLAMIGAAFWAGYTVNGIGSSKAPTVEPIWAEASEGSIGRTIALSVEAIQERRAVAVNRLPGTVTARSNETEFSVGDPVYFVDGQAVRVVEGGVPFYRDLYEGLIGDDVSQLNAALTALGYPAGGEATFTDQTAAGVRQWHKDQGREATGEIPLGELIAVPSLPARLFLHDDGAVGAVLTGGERLVFAVVGEPHFRTILTAQQVSLVPEGTPVSVTYADRTWQGRIGSAAPDDQGVIHADVLADVGLLCGAECDALPAEEKVVMSALAEVVPAQTGVLVPVSAITVDVNGAATLVVEGEGGVVNTPVTVLGSQDGLALVDGIASGTRVRIGDPSEGD